MAHLHDFSQLVVSIPQCVDVVDVPVPDVVVVLHFRTTATPNHSGSLELIYLFFHYEVELAGLLLLLLEQLVVFLKVGY